MAAGLPYKKVFRIASDRVRALAKLLGLDSRERKRSRKP
jgi:hypothetical protein